MVLSEWIVAAVMDSSGVGWEWVASAVINKFEIDLFFVYFSFHQSQHSPPDFTMVSYMR